MHRTLRWNGEKGVGFLAMEEGVTCGIVGSHLDADDPTRTHLISRWTAPTHRQRGVGHCLVRQVLAGLGNTERAACSCWSLQTTIRRSCSTSARDSPALAAPNHIPTTLRSLSTKWRNQSREQSRVATAAPVAPRIHPESRWTFSVACYSPRPPPSSFLPAPRCTSPASPPWSSACRCCRRLHTSRCCQPRSPLH